VVKEVSFSMSGKSLTDLNRPTKLRSLKILKRVEGEREGDL
jgi:hypothetical protein